MKTIQFTGEVNQLDDLTQNLTDNYLDLMTETRVYVVDTHQVFNKSHSELTDEEFIKLAEENNENLSLSTFQKHFNIGEYDEPHYVIRFINQPIY
jgi:hypothetical protein